MQDHRTHLATLVASRICHDLISPVGAISNGLELMSLGGGMSNGPEMALISESCASANARIRFLRIAYGSGRDASAVSTKEIRTILSGMAENSRISLHWDSEADCPRCDAQLAFLGVQCLETALRRGGEIRVTRDDGQVCLTARAGTLSLDPVLWGHLEAPLTTGSVLGDHLDIAPSNVQFALLPMIASEMGRRPKFVSTEGALTLRV